jgi:hypothetical protein
VRILSHKGLNSVSDRSAPRPTPTAYSGVYCHNKLIGLWVLSGMRFEVVGVSATINPAEGLIND